MPGGGEKRRRASVRYSLAFEVRVPYVPEDSIGLSDSEGCAVVRPSVAGTSESDGAINTV